MNNYASSDLIVKLKHFVLLFYQTVNGRHKLATLVPLPLTGAAVVYASQSNEWKRFISVVGKATGTFGIAVSEICRVSQLLVL